ncbi:MAG TPA: FAD-binding protein [Candidatus Limnocylindrales bacterium]|nr:FAD-binding protein [Candidatus Limnocylindrales bacterium]
MTAGLPGGERVAVDVAVVGSGAAGLMAVRHAHRADPRLRVALLSKGLVGRSGCSIMAQGLNAALGADDDPAIHARDIVEHGQGLADPRLAEALARDAPDVVRELDEELGCAFDRDPRGGLALAPFPGQSRARKVSHGHLTGLEVVGRLRDDLLRTAPLLLEDVRALDLLVDERGVAGLVALDIRRGRPIVVATRVVVLAAGGSAAASYRVATPAREKAGDGLALALRAGLAVRDMEMVQFLSVGLVAGISSLTGVLLEEALRFAGAELRNGRGERFMDRYDPERLERASRDVVARACFTEIAEGRGTPERAVLLDCRPIGRHVLEARFGELVARVRLLGLDPATEPIPIAPAAHIGIGGVVIDEHGVTELPGLLVAGEDAGGVHGASWAGGNGLAESTVFGRRAGRRAAELARLRGRPTRLPEAAIEASLAQASAPLRRPVGESPDVLRRELAELLWTSVGLRRDATGLRAALERIVELRERSSRIGVAGGAAASVAWQEALDLASRLAVAEAVTSAALARTESRGVHVRVDFPNRDDGAWLRPVVVRGLPGALDVSLGPVPCDLSGVDVAGRPTR